VNVVCKHHWALRGFSEMIPQKRRSHLSLCLRVLPVGGHIRAETRRCLFPDAVKSEKGPLPESSGRLSFGAGIKAISPT